jgi:hypothetical protein
VRLALFLQRYKVVGVVNYFSSAAAFFWTPRAAQQDNRELQVDRYLRTGVCAQVLELW